MAVILAGGEGERLSILSQERAKPAVPFGGKYRIIDFTLSNCVNSDIDDVVVLTQYNPRSLNDHIGLGRPWDLDRNRGGVKLLQPYIARGRVAEWYRGTADAVLRNLNVIEHDSSDIVLVLAGDHIYKMDYAPFVAAHRRHRADVTIAVRRVPLAEASRMGILALDEADRVIEWQEKPKQPKSDLASMGVYVFSKKTLRRWLSEDRVDFGANVIPAMLDAGARVFGYRYNGYWQDVGTIQSFWETNMALLDDNPELDLYDKDWVIHTRSEERAPAKVGPTAQVHKSLISHGCVIAGTVVNSVLSPGVRVDVGAVVRDSIIMFDSVIRSGRRGRPGDPRQGGRRRPGRHRRRRALRRPAEQAGAGTAEHGHHGDRQARRRAARRPDRAQRQGRVGRALVRLHRARGAQRRVGRDPAGVARAARAGRRHARRRRHPSAPWSARSRRPGRGRSRQEGRPGRLTRRRSPPMNSARLPGPCHPPIRARPACARPMSRTGSRISG